METQDKKQAGSWLLFRPATHNAKSTFPSSTYEADVEVSCFAHSISKHFDPPEAKAGRL